MSERPPVEPRQSATPAADTPWFTPALGRLGWTAAYDAAVALFTRERRWRAALVALAAPSPGDVLVDLGCGTGTLAVRLKRMCPAAAVHGVDPDPAVLAIARRKAARAGVDVTWHEAMGDRLPDVLGAASVTTVVSSLVFHQCAMPVKRALLRAAFTALRPGGTLAVADYGLQRTRVMRGLFRIIQALDGAADTTPNARGVLPDLMWDAGFTEVAERDVVSTPTGSISLYIAHRPAGPSGAAASARGEGDGWRAGRRDLRGQS